MVQLETNLVGRMRIRFLAEGCIFFSDKYVSDFRGRVHEDLRSFFFYDSIRGARVLIRPAIPKCKVCTGRWVESLGEYGFVPKKEGGGAEKGV